MIKRLRHRIGVDSEFAFDILGQEDWTGRRMVADRFRDQRVFLCGDAAHIWVPFAGYGMNAGIADAMNLSWMLAGVIHGWAHPMILNSYQIELVLRDGLAVGQVTSAAYGETIGACVGLAYLWQRDGSAVTPDYVKTGAYEINVGQFCCGGLNFGYFYADSPIVAYDGEPPPAFTMYDFKQSTVPGCRTPHLWLRDGRSLYDALGPDFTLLRFHPDVEVGGLVAAAARRGLPLALFDAEADDAAALYPCKLLLSRPDQHVAWRGDKLPDDPLALIDKVRGAGA